MKIERVKRRREEEEEEEEEELMELKVFMKEKKGLRLTPALGPNLKEAPIIHIKKLKN